MAPRTWRPRRPRTWRPRRRTKRAGVLLLLAVILAILAVVVDRWQGLSWLLVVPAVLAGAGGVLLASLKVEAKPLGTGPEVPDSPIPSTGDGSTRPPMAPETNSVGLVSAGVSAYQGGNETAATQLFKRSAGLGSPGGMTGLGVLLARRGQTKQAEELFRRAANLGDATGMSSLGVLLAGRARRNRPRSCSAGPPSSAAPEA
jgi:hypothetical protein